MRTRRSISIACCFASGLLTFRWRRSASAICSPTGNAGLSEVIGSWKMIESWSPRRIRMRLSGSRSRSTPSNSTSPASMRPGGCGTRRMIESAVTLLPQPDSPTMPSVRPRARLKSTPSTARTSPCSPSNEVRSPRTSSRFCVAGNRFFYGAAIEHAPGPRLARRAAHIRDEALVRLFVQAPQLGERLGVVVDPQVELRIVFARMDDERRGLLAALVAACGFARDERRDQALGKGTRAGLLIRSRGFPQHPFVRQHVARDRIAIAGERAAPVDAGRARVLAHAALDVDDVELALLASFIRGGQALDHFGRRDSRAQELEALGSVVRIDQRLGRERTDAASCMRAQRASCEEARRDGDAERAARRIARDDGPRHGAR